MFSDQLQKMCRFPQAGLLLAASGLVVVCQLVAMAMVTGEKVQSAGVRDLQRVARQEALGDCIQRSHGPSRHGCIHQSQLESDGGEQVVAGPVNDETSPIGQVASADKAAASDTAAIVRVSVASAR